MEAIDLSPLAHGNSGHDWQKAHDAIKSDERLWRRCALDGIQGDGMAALYEARRCPACESTILKPITREHALELCEHLRRLQTKALEALVLSPCCTAVPSPPAHQ